MDARDVAALLTAMWEREAQHARDSENLAMLVDRDDWWMTFDYVNAVTDPDDPQVKAERAERKRLKIEPPPVPLLRPVAHRAPDVTKALVERYHAESAKHALPQEKKPQGLAGLIEYMRG